MERALIAVALLATSGPALAARPVRLTWFEEAVPDHLHPLYAWSDAERHARALVYEHLFDPATGESHLVASTQVDGRAVTLTLHDGLRWHDGAPLTGLDVCFTAAFLLDAPGAPRAPAVRAQLADCTVDPEDARIVHVELTRPMPDARAALSFPLIPAHLDPDPEALHPSYSSAPVGSGPLAATRTVDGWAFEPASTSRRTAPVSLRMAAGGPTPARTRGMLGGGADGVALTAPELLPEVREHGVGLYWVPRDELWSLVLDVSGPALSDVRVREALDLLVDRVALRERIIGVDPARDEQPCTLISGPFPHTSDHRNRAVEVPVHDAERASALLTAAGLTQVDGAWHGDSGPVRLALGVPTGHAVDPGIATTVLSELLVGFEVVGRELDGAEVQEVLAGAGPELDLLLLPWTPEPDGSVAPLFHTRTEAEGWANPFGFSDRGVDGLLAAWSEAPEPLERTHAYRALHARLADLRPHLFLFQLDGWAAFTDEVHVVAHPSDLFGAIHMWKVKDRKKRR